MSKWKFIRETITLQLNTMENKEMTNYFENKDGDIKRKYIGVEQ